MDYSEILSISGLPGLYKLVSHNKNGIFVESIENGNKKFISSLNSKVVSLDNVSIYTNEDSIEMKEVFKRMTDQAEKQPVVDPKASNDELKNYFETIIPEYDEERVYTSDMKKVIKWYNLLKAKDLLSFEEDEEQTKPEKKEEKKKPASDKKQTKAKEASAEEKKS